MYMESLEFLDDPMIGVYEMMIRFWHDGGECKAYVLLATSGFAKGMGPHLH